MATSPTLDVYKTEVLNSDLSGLMDGITDAQFVALLNQAIINKHDELLRDCPSSYSGSETLTFSSDSNSIALPTDIDPDETRQVLLYNDISRDVSTILQDNEIWRRYAGELRFDSLQKSGQVYYIEYTIEPNEYETTGLSSQTFTEGVNRRAKKYINYELRRLYYDSLRLNEPSSAGANLRIQANDIS